MTETAFVALVMCICNSLTPQGNNRYMCMEAMVNCAIVKDGQILSREKIDKKCNLVPKQKEICR